MKKLFRKNHWSTEDKLLAGAAVVGAVGIFLVVKQKRDAAAATPTAGLRGLRGLRGIGEYFAAPMNGLGAYFVDPVVQQISGLGAYRGR